MEYLNIESGSKGNATLVINKGRILLIDMGVSLCALQDALKSINKNIYNIEALLLTHEHSDHTKGIQYLPPVDIYTLEGTYDSKETTFLELNKTTQLIGLNITPIKTSHDVKNPCGFLFESENEKLCYITDTGKLNKTTLNKIVNCDYYIFESNYDEEMLMNTNRPMFLKKRILSNKGHLSNIQSATYLSNIIGPKTKEILLAHLSEEANTPQKALSTHKEIYKINNIDLTNIKLRCANQHKITKGGSK